MAYSRTFGSRDAYHHLLNADEYPDVLPFALELVRDRLRLAASSSRHLPAHLGRFRSSPSKLPHLLSALGELASIHHAPWESPDEAVARHQTKHYLTQYLPTVLVEGCWLQGFPRVATAHTQLGARMTAAYARHVQAHVTNPGQRLVTTYRDLHARLVAPVEDPAAPSFTSRREFRDLAFDLPVLLLSIGQFPRTFLPEIVGLHLAWHYLDSASFGRRLVRVAGRHLWSDGENRLDATVNTESDLTLAGEACELMLQNHLQDLGATWARVWSGIALAVTAWTTWLEEARQSARQEPEGARHAMIALLCRKAPHAAGYHRQKQLDQRLIDDYLDADRFDPETLLDKLAASHHITPGDPDRSPFLRRVTAFGGPMYGVFSEEEMRTVANWIRSLAPAYAPHPTASRSDIEGADRPSHSPLRRAGFASPRPHEPAAPTTETCSIRELYYRLVNLEFFPSVLPVAERFARARLAQAMLTITTGARPIPAERYDPELLQEWVHRKHREQVDSYRPWNRQPRISRKTFVDATVELAPLILIDGSWLQGTVHPSLIHRSVGSLLFKVFYEEIGEGQSAHHHANIYRDLLTAMGESVPDVHTEAFAHWTRLRDSSFYVPTLWLSLSCFSRHFLPELLGLNLAVELAGVGGPYLEAHDALKHFGYPTLFVDVHNAADNVSVGHAASAMTAIMAHMDDVVATEGPHNTDYHWHRVWSGMCLTLPQVGPIRMAYRRLAAGVAGSHTRRLAPPIFQT